MGKEWRFKGNEVHYTARSLLVMVKHSRSKLHWQRVFQLKLFSYEILHDQPPVLINPILREGECLLEPSGGHQRGALCYTIEARDHCLSVARALSFWLLLSFPPAIGFSRNYFLPSCEWVLGSEVVSLSPSFSHLSRECSESSHLPLATCHFPVLRALWWS